MLRFGAPGSLPGRFPIVNSSVLLILVEVKDTVKENLSIAFGRDWVQKQRKDEELTNKITRYIVSRDTWQCYRHPFEPIKTISLHSIDPKAAI